MLSNRGNIPDAAAMISRGMRTGSQNKFTLQVAKTGNSSSHGGKFNPAKTKGHVEGGNDGCSHCGNLKHTRETCFKIHGYPEWWTELKARKQKEAAGGTGRAAMVNSAPINPEATLSLVRLVESKEDTAASLGNPGNNSSNDSSAYLCLTQARMKTG
jgi:hypothetical protein